MASAIHMTTQAHLCLLPPEAPSHLPPSPPSLQAVTGMGLRLCIMHQTPLAAGFTYGNIYASRLYSNHPTLSHTMSKSLLLACALCCPAHRISQIFYEN